MSRHLLSSIPLPSLPLNIEWLKLRSTLTTIPVPQPMTSNPQPEPYRNSPISHFFSGHTKKQICFPTRKPSFSQGFSDDADLAKSPEMRHSLILIYLSLTTGRCTLYALSSGNCQTVSDKRIGSRSMRNTSDSAPGSSGCRKCRRSPARHRK